jgi:hypothetical protein
LINTAPGDPASIFSQDMVLALQQPLSMQYALPCQPEAWRSGVQQRCNLLKH